MSIYYRLSTPDPLFRHRIPSSFASDQILTPRSIPNVHLDGVDIVVISGESHGATGFVRPVGGCWYFDYKLSKPGVKVHQPLPKGWTGFAYGECPGCFSSTP